jgi:hypothetical protein
MLTLQNKEHNQPTSNSDPTFNNKLEKRINKSNLVNVIHRFPTSTNAKLITTDSKIIVINLREEIAEGEKAS